MYARELVFTDSHLLTRDPRFIDILYLVEQVKYFLIVDLQEGAVYVDL